MLIINKLSKKNSPFLNYRFTLFFYYFYKPIICVYFKFI